MGAGASALDKVHRKVPARPGHKSTPRESCRGAGGGNGLCVGAGGPCGCGTAKNGEEETHSNKEPESETDWAEDRKLHLQNKEGAVDNSSPGWGERAVETENNNEEKSSREGSCDLVFSSPKDRSVWNLRAVLFDPFLKEKFRVFLARRLCEHLLFCWTDLELYRKLPAADVRGAKARAAQLFKQYFTTNLSVDSACIEEIRQTLRMEQSGSSSCSDIGGSSSGITYTVKEKRPPILLGAFREAQEKVFSVLLFDHLPIFLGTEDLDALKTEATAAVQDQRGIVSPRGITPVGDAFLESPMILHFLRKYLVRLQTEKEGGMGETILDCLLEVRDYQSSQCLEHRLQRRDLIFLRYHSLASVQRVLESGRGESQALDLFSPVYRECLTLLCSRHMADFEASKEFTALSKACNSLEMTVTASKVDKLHKNFQGLHTSSNQHAMTKLGMAAPLSHRPTGTMASSASSSALEGGGGGGAGSSNMNPRSPQSPRGQEGALITLHHVFSDPLGTSLFKRFCLDNFEDEHINFYLAIRSYANREYIAPQYGTLMHLPPSSDDKGGGAGDDIDMDQVKLERARMIFRKHLREDSVQAVNLSYHMIQDIAKKIEVAEKDPKGTDLNEIFAQAEKEVFSLMRLNLFARFKETTSFAFWLEKHILNQKRGQSSLNKIGTGRKTVFSKSPLLSPPRKDPLGSNRIPNRGVTSNLDRIMETHRGNTLTSGAGMEGEGDATPTVQSARGEGQAQGGQAQGGQAQGGQAQGGQAQGEQAQGGQAQGEQAQGGQAQGEQAQGGQAQGVQQVEQADVAKAPAEAETPAEGPAEAGAAEGGAAKAGAAEGGTAEAGAAEGGTAEAGAAEGGAAKAGAAEGGTAEAGEDIVATVPVGAVAGEASDPPGQQQGVGA